MIKIKRLVKKQYILFVILMIIIGFLLAAGQEKLSTKTTKKETTKKNEDLKQINLPIAMNHPGLVHLSVLYTFVGEIWTIDQSSLTLQSGGDPLPKFNLDQYTEFYQVIADSPRADPINRDQFKAGSNVILTLSYDPKNGSWRTARITLNEPKFQSVASPSATLK